MDKDIFDSIVKGGQQAIEYLEAKKQGKPIPKGVVESTVAIPENIDLKALRAKLNYTQERFAASFGIPLSTLKKWETGERSLDASTRAFLTVISKNPKVVQKALHS